VSTKDMTGTPTATPIDTVWRKNYAGRKNPVIGRRQGIGRKTNPTGKGFYVRKEKGGETMATLKKLSRSERALVKEKKKKTLYWNFTVRVTGRRRAFEKNKSDGKKKGGTFCGEM